MKKHLKKIAWAGFGGFMAVGLFNGFVIGHNSEIGGEIIYVKGLDEMYGITQPGRVLATKSSWKKIDSPEREKAPEPESPQVAQDPAEIPEDLKLDLVEVINPRIWPKGLQSIYFEGDLQTLNGTIETLYVNLPEKEEIAISFAEMNGNVFQYDYAGEVYSGMLYQVDPKSYMVTLTNGPLEGTRLRFVTGFTDEQLEIQETLKEEHNVEVGHFGDNPEAPVKENSKPLDPSVVEAQMVNMDAQV